MHRKYFALGAAAIILATLAYTDGDAQQPGKKGPPFGKKGGPFAAAVTSEQIVERLLAFDKNNDSKIITDELPERMQHLVALGDANKDGALDRDEIRKLATTLEAFAGLTTPAGPVGAKGPGGFKGDGPKGFGLKGAPKSVAEAQRTLDDLNITGAAREKADRVLQKQADKLKKFDELSRAELVLEMKAVLADDDYRAFKAALDVPGGPKGGFKKGPPNLERRIEQLQQELDELRKKLPK
jgi:hypothetical protein